jgi:hypothetical protein
VQVTVSPAPASVIPAWAGFPSTGAPLESPVAVHARLDSMKSGGSVPSVTVYSPDGTFVQSWMLAMLPGAVALGLVMMPGL